jgi:hypothetical protein
MILRGQRPLPHRLILLGTFVLEQTRHAVITPQTLSFEVKRCFDCGSANRNARTRVPP